jgi:hypothetical protein
MSRVPRKLLALGMLVAAVVTVGLALTGVLQQIREPRAPVTIVAR